MKKLSKYILIIVILSFVLMLLFGFFQYKEKEFVKRESAKITEPTNIPVAVPHSAYFELTKIVVGIMFYALPLLTLLFAILYLIKNISWTGYFKSLLIPLAFIASHFVGFLVSNNFIHPCSGEGCMIFLFYLFMYIGTLGGILVINLIINLIMKGVKRK